jgi:hypothetical protein
VSENLDLVRSIQAAWQRGKFENADWAHPEIECVMVDGPTPDSGSGLAGMARVWREFLSAYHDFLGYRGGLPRDRRAACPRALSVQRAWQSDRLGDRGG